MTETGAIRPLLWPALVTMLGVALLVALGLWQLQRLAWKEALIAAVADRVGRPPSDPPPEADWPRLDRDALEYRRIRLVGSFRHQDEVRVFTTLSEPKGPVGGVGYWVMTPLVLESGAVIVVNRGFVPSDKADPATRPAGQVDGLVTIEGLLRWSEERNLFTPADDPAKGTWYTRDPPAIARAKGLPRVAPFFVDAEASGPGGLPEGGETRLAFPNNHLQYAFTWFGLAGALLVVFGIFAAKARRPSATMLHRS
jgi:surfeit locus 1 family protein